MKRIIVVFVIGVVVGVSRWGWADPPARVRLKKGFVESLTDKLSESPLVEQLTDQKYMKSIESGRSGEDVQELLSTLKDPFVPQLPKERPRDESQIANVSSPDESHTSVKTNTLPSSVPGEPDEIVIQKPAFRISGIVWNTSRPQAIIEGRVVDVGDTIDQWLVHNINAQGVELTFSNAKYVLTP